MSEDNDREILLEALTAGGYAPAAISAAQVAVNRGLGKRTTAELVSAADPAAGKIATAIFGGQNDQPAAPKSDAEQLAAAERWMNDILLSGTGRGPVGGEES